jgi:acyl-CoA reductase-like NAD-dependent aldehyde dehydrogenase
MTHDPALVSPEREGVPEAASEAVSGGAVSGAVSEVVPVASPLPDPEARGTPPPLDPVLRIRRPADGGLVGEVPVDDRAAVEAALARVRAVQPGWGARSPRERAQLLAGLRREITRRTTDIVDRIVAETGKPESEALAEVLMILKVLGFYLRRAPRWLRPKRVRTGILIGTSGWVLREPVGVVGVISPWNYPFILSMEPTLTALFGGNGVVLKPSEHTPFTGAFVQDLCEGAGLPEDLVVVVFGRRETGEALIDARPDHLHLVGGTATGRAVLRRAAETLLPVTLELGGKDPAIVRADADLERAARGIAFGGFYNAGQTCLSTERVFVHESVYEPFLKQLVRETAALRAGTGGEVDLGPITVGAQLQIVEAHVRDAVDRGARILTGGDRADPASNVYLPTVLADVPRDARVLREETFGPLLPVVSVADDDEAVARVNEHPMGLFASVWTRDHEAGKRLARRLRAGGVSINDTLSHWAVPGLPMGGVGDSGSSRARGEEGLLAFTRTRSLLLNRGWFRRELWWYPYRPVGRRMLRALLGWEGHRGVRALAAAVVRFLDREVR